MSGFIEVDKCDICLQVTYVTRKYYYYNIKCDCCNDKDSPHFEIVKYCKNCIPKSKNKITVYIDPMTDDKLKIIERNKKLNKLIEKIN